MTVEATYPDTRRPAATDDEPALVPNAKRSPRRLLGPFVRRALVVFGAPLLGAAAVVTVLVTCFQTKYLINDDASLAALVNGSYTGHRTSSLVIAPAMLGHVERIFYWLVPHLPWYGISLYVLQIVAWAIIVAVVFTLRRRPPVAERLVVASGLVAFVPWMTLRPSYTPTSIIIGVVGVLVFAVAARAHGRIGTVYAVGAGILLGSAYLVRSSSFLAVVVAFAPVLAIIAFKAGLRRSAVFALAVGTLLLLGFGTNYLQSSSTPEWRAFTKMNKARGALHDTPRLQNVHVSNSALKKIGWTRNDLWLFSDFVYPARDVYTDHDIEELAKLSPFVREEHTTKQIVDTLVHRSTDSTTGGDRGPILASLVILAALLVLRWNRSAAAAVVISAVWFVGVLVALLLYIRLPGRVMIPLDAGAVVLAAAVPAYLSGSAPRVSVRWPRTAIVVAVVVALFAVGPAWHGVRAISKDSRENTNVIKQKRSMIAALTAFDPQGVFAARGDFFGQGADPLSTKGPFDDPKLIPLGWAQSSPLFTARLARAGITDLTTALHTQRHVYFLGLPIEAYRLTIFYLEHRGTKVTFTHVGPSFPGGLFVWSVTDLPAH